MTPKETVKTKQTHKPVEQSNNLCHVSNYCDAVDYIRIKVCQNLNTTKHTDGEYYCILHLPSKIKSIVEFEEIFQARLKEVENQVAENENVISDNPTGYVLKTNRRQVAYDFRYVCFPSRVDLYAYKFVAFANFSSTIFLDDANFKLTAFSSDANFTNAKFSKDHLTKFNKANFEGDIFFDNAEFNNNVTFNSAIFGKDSNVFFRGTFFAKWADFRYCISEGLLRFSILSQGDDNRFLFDEAAFEKASRISFHTLRLRPNWFINVDSRKFIFTNIGWENIEIKTGIKNIETELKQLETRKTPEPRRLLEISCRQLAVNAEENNRYEEASRFRYMAMETKRLDESITTRFVFWLYKWTSCYGESWSWAAFVLAIVLGFSAFLYTQFDFYVCPQQVTLTRQFDLCETRKLNAWEGIKQSMSVATLQKIEHRKPIDEKVEWISIFEMIFAPLQAALLALAIRRKFMR